MLWKWFFFLLQMGTKDVPKFLVLVSLRKKIVPVNKKMACVQVTRVENAA